LGVPAQNVSAISRDEGRQLFQQHSDWVLPAWTGGGPSTWTMVGPPYGGNVTLVGSDGNFTPRNHGPSVTVWMYDVDADQLIVPAVHAWQFHLQEDTLPIIEGTLDVADLHVTSTFFAGAPDGDVARWFDGHGTGADQSATFMRLEVRSTSRTPRQLAVYLALRPFGTEPDMHPIGTAECDASHALLKADGAVMLVGLQPASACGATSFSLGEASTFAAHNRVPRASVVADDAQRAEALLQTNVTLSAPDATVRLDYRVPLSFMPATPETLDALLLGSFEEARARVADAWRPVLNRLAFDVSDQRVNDAFRASQMYLLENRNGILPRSGPLAHDAFWVRDAAYIGEALERIGDARDNQATLDALLSKQRDDGSFPAISDANGPRPVDEWDASGQAIGGIVSHYRFTQDRAWLEHAYPSIARAVQFLDALRGRTLTEGPETRTLLPANVSAEDLGSATWHHYWDDLWAIAGYREAAYAATELAKPDDAAAFAARADDLQAVLLHSVDLVDARVSKPFIPNGPEDVLSSSMARGTGPALWPVRSLRGDAAEALLRRSFINYFSAWMAPQGGGYRHYQDTLWPYGGLGVAHAMLRLGMRAEVQQVLSWTLDHQTLPGVYAWGEAINPSNGGLELGDMPHSWAAAELISLLRDMLLAENDGVLEVNSGAPDAWFDKPVSLRDAPTQYGPASVTFARPADDASVLRVTLTGQPPNGWHVHLPGAPREVQVDAAPPTPISQPDITLQTGPHTLLARYEKPGPTRPQEISPRKRASSG
jgi:hypothetical protein